MPKDNFNNRSKKQVSALYFLKNINSKNIKGGDKGFEVILWGAGNIVYKKVFEVYKKVTNDDSNLDQTISVTLNKIRATGDFSVDALKYFFNKKPKFTTFYLLPKIQKRLYNVPTGPPNSNFG